VRPDVQAEDVQGSGEGGMTIALMMKGSFE